MFWKATLAQTGFLLKRKGAVFTFYILLAMVLANFAGNVIAFQGMDVVNMYHPMKILLLSYDRVNYNADFTILIVQLYPLLAACPAGFALARERQTGQDVLMAARLGNLTYRFSKLTAAALATAIVFSAPFLIEIGLNCLAFPLGAQGDLSNQSAYDPAYIRTVKNYLFSGLYLCSPYLYAVLGTLFFGVLSGLICGFTAAFASIFKVKFRALLILPPFLLLNASVYLSSLCSDSGFSIPWYHYFLLFDEETKSPIYLCTVIAVLLLGAVTGTLWGGKRDCIP